MIYMEVVTEPKGFIFASSSFPEHSTLVDMSSSYPEHSTLGNASIVCSES